MIPKVTVVITSYNLSGKINICLKELAEQTFGDFEIIIVDDHSTDNTRDEIDSFKPVFESRLKTIYCEKNKGSPGITRNIALDSGLINGEYLVFLDGDDNIEKHFLEKLYNKAVAENADVVCCGYNRVNASTGKEYSCEMINFYTDEITPINDSRYVPLINGSLWNKLIRTNCIGSKRIPDIRVGEDAAFLLNVYSNVKKIVFIDDVLIHYNVNEKSLMSTIPQKEMVKLSDEFIRLYTTIESKEYKDAIIFSAFIHIGISVCVRAYQGKDIDIHEHIRWTKEYFDKNFPDWDGSKYLKLSSLRKLGIKGLAIKVCILLYKFGLFTIFLWAYDIMITKFGKDIKW